MIIKHLVELLGDFDEEQEVKIAIGVNEVPIRDVQSKDLVGQKEYVVLKDDRG